MTIQNFPSRPASYDKKIALVLQGGGALGSYQAGAYEALSTSAYLPDWVAGISIGAINAAIIAGNPPLERVKRLRAFWEHITAPTSWLMSYSSSALNIWEQKASALSSICWGQPGFFTPLSLIEWLPNKAVTSFYSTARLKHTLETFVDFDYLNQDKEVRLSVAAVNIRTGQLAYFDSAEISIRPEHVMASAALPPGFPPIEIEGEYYWDGGLVSNTPLQHILDYYPRRSRLTFQVDLFQDGGNLPNCLEDVFERKKDIRYSSRTLINTENFRQKHEVRHAINELYKILPDDIAHTEQGNRLYSFGCVTEMDIVQLIHRPLENQCACKDYEFSRNSMEARWKCGLSDAANTLLASPWLAPKPKEIGVRVFDIARTSNLNRPE